VNQTLGSRYVLHEMVGRGATGQVFRASTRDAETPVAVKVLKPELVSDPELVARFLQESTILTSINHPGVVKISDLVVEGNTFGIVMEYIAGQDLRSHLRRRGTLPPAEAAGLTRQILDGVATVHASGVIHRDIKPENLLLDTSGGGTVAKLTDFGVARLSSGASLTKRTSLIGTPEYMAPEVADGGAVTPAVDLYSIGILLYEMLGGETPFTGGHPLAVLRRHVDQPPAPIPGIPRELWDYLGWLLAKDPGSRPGSAADAAAALVPLQPGLAGLAALPPIPVRGPAAALTAAPPKAPPPLTPPATSPRSPHGAGSRSVVMVLTAAVLILIAVVGFLMLRPHDGPSVSASPPAVHHVSAAPTALTLRSLSVSPSTVSLARGSAAQLALSGQLSTGGPASAQILSGVRWTTGDAAVATVSSTGVVTAVGPGKTPVTAQIGPVHVSSTVTVIQPPRTQPSHPAAVNGVGPTGSVNSNPGNSGPRVPTTKQPGSGGGPSQRPTATQTPGAVTAVTFPETVGLGTATWSNYTTAGGTAGAYLNAGQTVQVTCAIPGRQEATGNADWYEIASSPWNNAFYAPSMYFYNNGQTSGPLGDLTLVDPKVPSC
jgi:serine/threonine protein kinase, bacterial